MAQRRKKRIGLLDTIRGITIVSMVFYHACWDIDSMLVQLPWYHTQKAFIWQQSICWTFILLSGLCINYSRHLWRRGLTVFGAGLLVTAATIVFVPQDRIIFGVLTFIGSAMLITALLRKVLCRIPPVFGILINSWLFYLFYHVRSGFVTLWPGYTAALPEQLYHGLAATFVGFKDPSFWSTDYFALLPWLFLFWAGMYLGRILVITGADQSGIMQMRIPPFSFWGQHSLLIYLLHQPLLYVIFTLLQRAG